MTIEIPIPAGSIIISPPLLLFLALLAADIALGRAKGDAWRKIRMICCILLAAVGIAAILMLRQRLAATLEELLFCHQYFDQDWIDSLLWRYDRFASFSLPATAMAALTLGALLLTGQISPTRFTGFTVLSMVLLLTGALWFGISTLNKWFNLASWCHLLSLAEIGALHLLFVLRDILAGRNRSQLLHPPSKPRD